jgi:hypothetical protein
METRRTFMHGQWVDVELCPPAPAARMDGRQTIQAKGTSSQQVEQTSGTLEEIERDLGRHYRPIEEVAAEAREESRVQKWDSPRSAAELESDRAENPLSWDEWCEMAGVETDLTAAEYFDREMPTPRQVKPRQVKPRQVRPRQVRPVELLKRRHPSKSPEWLKRRLESLKRGRSARRKPTTRTYKRFARRKPPVVPEAKPLATRVVEMHGQQVRITVCPPRPARG